MLASRYYYSADGKLAATKRYGRGQYERGHFQGGYAECTEFSGAGTCIHVEWPAPRLRTYFDGRGRPQGDWVAGHWKNRHQDRCRLAAMMTYTSV